MEPFGHMKLDGPASWPGMFTNGVTLPAIDEGIKESICDMRR